MAKKIAFIIPALLKYFNQCERKPESENKNEKPVQRIKKQK